MKGDIAKLTNHSAIYELYRGGLVLWVPHYYLSHILLLTVQSPGICAIIYKCLLQCNVILQSIKYVWLSCKRLHPVIPNLYNLCHFYAMIHCIVAFHYVTPCMHKTGVPQPDLICLFLCLGLMLLLNIWGHIATVPVCSSGTLTNVLPHRNVMPQTQNMTPHPVIVYRHAGPTCPLKWNVTLEYTTTHFNVLGQTRSGNPSLTFHTYQQMLNFMILIWW